MSDQEPTNRPPAATPPPERSDEPLTPQMQKMVARSLGSDSSHGRRVPPNPEAAARAARPEWQRDITTIRVWVTVIGWCVLAATVVSAIALWMAYDASQSSGF